MYQPSTGCKRFKVCVGLRRGGLELAERFSTYEPVIKELRKILHAVGFPVRTHRRVGRFQLIKPVMLFRKAQIVVPKMSKLMRDGACFGNVNFSISAARRAD